MAATPSGDLIIQALQGHPVDPSRAVRGNANKDAVADTLTYILGGPRPPAKPYGSWSGVCGVEILGYEGAYLIGLMGALLHAARTGDHAFAQAVKRRTEELLSCWALFRCGRWPAPVIPVGGRRGHGPKHPYFASPLGANLEMAITGRAVTSDVAARPTWWAHKGTGAALCHRMILEEQPEWAPRISPHPDDQVRVARSAGLLQEIVYARYIGGSWAAWAPEGIDAHDNRAFAAKGGPAGCEELSPRTTINEEWRVAGQNGRVTVDGRIVSVSCRVQRATEFGGSRPGPLEDWSGSLSLPQAMEFGRWSLKSVPWTGWDLGEGQPRPTPPPTDEEEEPMPKSFELNPDDLRAADWDAVTGANKLAGLTALRVLADRDPRAETVWRRLEPEILRARKEASDG